jgi:hypothetical protein
MAHSLRKSVLRIAACLALGTAAAVPALHAQDASSPERIQGLGEAHPRAPDVSLSPRFHVYVFPKDGIDYIQINGLDGKVLAAVAAANGRFYTLPIGTLPASRILLPGASAATIGPVAEGDGQCPCGGQVVYSGPNGTIVVVTDRNGNIIQVITLTPQPRSQ